VKRLEAYSGGMGNFFEGLGMGYGFGIAVGSEAGILYCVAEEIRRDLMPGIAKRSSREVVRDLVKPG
jgi:hypothetical protein